MIRESFNPKVLWELRQLFPVVVALNKLYETLPPLFWTLFRQAFNRRFFKDIVIANRTGNRLGAAATPVRFLVWSIFSLLLLLLAVVVRLGTGSGVYAGIFLFSLLAVLTTVLWLLIAAAATVFISWHGVVFLIGGAASILYLSNPILGGLLIAAGVCLEHESRRRRERQNREQLGRVLRIIEQKGNNLGIRM